MPAYLRGLTRSSHRRRFKPVKPVKPIPADSSRFQPIQADRTWAASGQRAVCTRRAARWAVTAVGGSAVGTGSPLVCGGSSAFSDAGPRAERGRRRRLPAPLRFERSVHWSRTCCWRCWRWWSKTGDAGAGAEAATSVGLVALGAAGAFASSGGVTVSVASVGVSSAATFRHSPCPFL